MTAKAKIKYPFRKYATAPNMREEEWPSHIQEMERERSNEISYKEAKQIYETLWAVSRQADKDYREAKKDGSSETELDKIKKGVFIVKDRETGMIKGRVTPSKRESLGIERKGARGKQSGGSLRSRHDAAPADYTSGFLEGIKAREIAAGLECDDDRAKSILVQGKQKNGFFKFDWGSKTWRGSRTPKPTKEDIKRLKSPKNLYPRQRWYWDIFGAMPLLPYTYYRHWDPDKCEVIKWTIARCLELGETIDATEANRRYKNAWKVSKTIKAKNPLRKDPATDNVCGRNYYLPSMLRWMPALTERTEEFDDWAVAEIRTGGDPHQMLESAIACGDVIVLLTDDEGLRFCKGADKQAADLKELEERKAAERAKREEQERMERERQEAAERKAREELERAIAEEQVKFVKAQRKNAERRALWEVQLTDPESKVAKKFRSMLLIEDSNPHQSAENWVMRCIDFRSDDGAWISPRDGQEAIEFLLRAVELGYVVRAFDGYHGANNKPRREFKIPFGGFDIPMRGKFTKDELESDGHKEGVRQTVELLEALQECFGSIDIDATLAFRRRIMNRFDPSYLFAAVRNPEKARWSIDNADRVKAYIAGHCGESNWMEEAADLEASREGLAQKAA